MMDRRDVGIVLMSPFKDPTRIMEKRPFSVHF